MRFRALDPAVVQMLHNKVYADFAEWGISQELATRYCWCVVVRALQTLDGHYTKMEH